MQDSDVILLWTKNKSPYASVEQKLRVIYEEFGELDLVERAVLFDVLNLCEEYAQRDLMLGQALHDEFLEKIFDVRDDVDQRRTILQVALIEVTRRLQVMNN